MGTTTRNRSLPIILLAAVIQGWVLYGLHHALANHHWPAANVPLTMALYTCAVLIPLTVQLLAEHAQTNVLWLLVTALSGVFFYFGWHFGAAIQPSWLQGLMDPAGASLFLFAFELMVLWLLMLPFLQSRLATGGWRVDYPALFTFAWRNKIMLFEAALFTGLFWLLLGLWQALFHMLQIDFFRELFYKPIFFYPATAVVFGIALHLIGGIERLVSAVLEQILNVLKWLATVAGVLLALFTLALLLKVPGLLFQGQKAIGATWLLWLIAAVVLFLNAAYRDGTIAQPYPRWIAQLLRFVVPLTTVIALTASYSLLIREQHYGFTVERFWAFVVAAAALFYAVGYSVSALSRGAWLARIAQVNVGVALALIVIIALSLTPLASPYRLAANSQYQKILNSRREDELNAPLLPSKNALQYLRWDAGSYGRERLEQLAKLDHHPDAERIRALALTLIQQKNPWQPLAGVDAKSILAGLNVYPTGRTLDEDLAATIRKDIEQQSYASMNMSAGEHRASGLYIDLNGDGVDEFVIFGCCAGVAYQHRTDGWIRIGHVNEVINATVTTAGRANGTGVPWTIETELQNQRVQVVPPAWQNLLIGGTTFRVDAWP